MIKPRIQHLPPLAVIVIIHIIVLSILAMSCSERQKEKSSTSSHQANEFRSISEEPDTGPLTSQDKSDTPKEMQAALDDAESTVEFCGRQWPLSTTGIGCVEPRDAPKPLDLTPLSKLTELKKLVLHNTSVENIAPLSSLVKLESLNLNDTKIKDLTPLIGLQKLRRLSLASTPGIDSFEPIRSISTLEYLNVNQNVNYKDHSITSKMGHLQTLIASLTGLNFLPQLPDQNSLKSLDIRGTKIQDISNITSLDLLEKLNLDETEVANLKPLASQKNLKELDISSTQVTDLSPLRNLISLQSLTVYKTKIDDFEPVSEIKGLKIYGRSE